STAREVRRAALGGSFLASSVTVWLLDGDITCNDSLPLGALARTISAASPHPHCVFMASTNAERGCFVTQALLKPVPVTGADGPQRPAPRGVGATRRADGAIRKCRVLCPLRAAAGRADSV